ncbi:MAG: hypothetical protein JXB39_02380 [Deltaproteobacteria bacterium]|nr:hypothetical protein [Deltaproteobacteria bacterium]
MTVVAAVAALEGLPGVVAREAEPVARHVALRIGGPVELWVVVADETALLAASAVLRAHGVRWRFLHGLSDRVVADEGLSGALVRPGPGFAGVEVDQGEVQAGVAAPLARIGHAAREAGLETWTLLEACAGTVGDWVSEENRTRLGPAIREVRVLQGRSFRNLPGARLGGLSPSARVVAVRLSGVLPRGMPLPPPPGALVDHPERRLSSMLEASGLLGLRIRAVRLPETAPGTVATLEGATARDLAFLERIVRERLFRDHGLHLEMRLVPAGRPPSRRTRTWMDRDQ